MLPTYVKPLSSGSVFPWLTADRIVTTNSLSQLATPSSVSTAQSVTLSGSATLTVAGLVTAQSGLTVSSNASISGTGTVTGLLTAQAGLSVSSNAAVSGTATVTGLLTASSALTVASTATLSGVTTVIDGNFSILGSGDPTKTIKFEVDAQTAADDLTINSGAQTDDRTATFPVLTGNSILALSNSTLASGRVPFATTNGILTDSANFTFSTTVCTIANTTNASNATTGAFVVGNGTSATSVAIGGGNIYAGGAANRFASGNVNSSGTTLQITKGSLATSGNDWGLLASTTVAPGSASSQNASGIAGNVSIASGASGISGGLTGLDGAIDADASANTFALTTALRGTMRKGGACTITMATAVEAAFSSTAAGTVTTAHGFYMSTMANSGGATITTAYGLRIEAVSIGATNYAIYTNAGLVRFGDEVLTTASSTTRAGLNIPHGSAPSSPVNGDMWTTTAGLFVRINGSTIGPLS